MPDPIPDAHFGTATTPLPDWRAAPDDPDPDDEQIKTPPDVTMMLGFDPADEGADEPANDARPDAPAAPNGALRKALRLGRKMVLFAAGL